MAAFFVTLAAPRGFGRSQTDVRTLYDRRIFRFLRRGRGDRKERRSAFCRFGSNKATFTDLSAVFDLDFAIEGKDGAAAFGAVSFEFTDKATGRSRSRCRARKRVITCAFRIRA
ncbi:MAG: hypothetical protein ACLUSP_07255 [Christensenellales bacterium]